MSKNKFFLACCFLTLIAAGCSNNPLLPPGTIGFGAETSSAGGFAAFHKAIAPASVTEFEMTVEKIEISATGDEWTGIYSGGQMTKVQGTTLEAVGDAKFVGTGSYEGVRVWFGKNLRAKDSYGNVTEWDDFDRDNPVTFSTRNGKLLYPFTVERGAQCFVVFRFNFSGYSGAPSPAGSPSLLNRPVITVRVSKFK